MKREGLLSDDLLRVPFHCSPLPAELNLDQINFFPLTFYTNIHPRPPKLHFEN